MDPAAKAAKAAKEKKQWVITSVLILIFAYSFTTNVLFRKKNVQPVSPAVSNTASLAQTMSEDLLFVTNLRDKDKQYQEQLKVWDKEWGRDPFEIQAALSSVIKAVNLTLGGVLWDEKTPKAIVNEKILMVGDTLYGYTVIEIKPRSVILKTGEKNIELSVFHSMFSDQAAVS